MLFPNGLGALEAVFQLIAHDLDSGRRPESKPIVLSGKDLYVEVKNSILAFCSRSQLDHKEILAYDTDTLISAIKEDSPCAVFLEPVANSYDLRVTEVGRVIEALREWDWRRDARYTSPRQDRYIYLVIDSTTLGPQALWKRCTLENLPPFVRVVNIESLIKYGEDGQDLTGAAVVTLAGRYPGAGFKNIRSRRGFMPSEPAARRVDFSIDRQALDRRLARHSRNTDIVARSLDKHAVAEGGFLDRPCHPLLAEHPDHEAFASEAGGSGSLLSVGFRYSLLKDYRELYGEPPSEWQGRPMAVSDKERIAKAYSTLVTQLAGDIGLDLLLGTSFGFNTSRIAVYTRQLVNDEHALAKGHREAPYLRVASGTETIKDAVLVAAVLKRADEIFSEAIRTRKVGELSDAILKRKAHLVSASVI
jgi:cystathionine beta-lyase/cystathionine gamma-synthase